MSVDTDDLERRVAALRLVLVQTLAHVGHADPEVLAHLSRLFREPSDNPAIRPDTIEYAAQLVGEAQRLADRHP
jgi:hypothetical protein